MRKFALDTPLTVACQPSRASLLVKQNTIRLPTLARSGKISTTYLIALVRAINGLAVGGVVNMGKVKFILLARPSSPP